jgi:hypothetical protein
MEHPNLFRGLRSCAQYQTIRLGQPPFSLSQHPCQPLLSWSQVWQLRPPQGCLPPSGLGKMKENYGHLNTCCKQAQQPVPCTLLGTNGTPLAKGAGLGVEGPVQRTVYRTLYTRLLSTPHTAYTT